MEISVLGPLRVTAAGRPVRLPAMQQTVLAILAFQPNRTVSTDRLIGALWGEDASPTAIKTLQSHVFQMRRLLAPEAGDGDQRPTIVTDGRGYRLDVDPMAIDARLFERLLEQARAESTPDPYRASGLLKEALALWRGPGLADVGDEPFATAEIERLGELHAAAFDELIQLRFALADYEGVIPELRRAVSESPFREQLWASLMVALVRSGRKAEALLAYREAETALRRELDVEPSRELQELAARIRLGDTMPLPPVLLPTGDVEPMAAAADDRDRPEQAAARTTSARTTSADRPSVRRRASLVALLAVVLIVGTLAVGSGRDEPQVVSVAADSVSRMDASGRLMASVKVGAQPDAIAIGAGSAWVSDASDDAVTRLDASGSTVIQRISVGDGPAGIAFGFGAVWVANSGDRTVSRIDPATNQVVDVVQVGTAPANIAADERWIWVTNRLDHTLSRIDPNDDSHKAFVVGSTPLGVAAAAGSVWVADFDSNSVVEVVAQSGVIQATVGVGRGPSSIEATPLGDAVWVANSRDGTVSRIDTKTAIVTAAISVGANPSGIGIGPDAVWVAVSSTSEIVKLDPASGQVIGRFKVGASPRSVVVDSAGPLFTARAIEGSHLGGTLNVVSPPDGLPASIDPSSGGALNLGFLTNDALVAYKVVGGGDGQTLVPDLATSVPASPDGGRTWTFQLRDGIKYSTGEPVRPGDVIGSFERAMRPGGTLESNKEIIGASTCESTTVCDLSRGITFDDQASTVSFHLVEPDPKFLSSTAFAFIVPAGTSAAESVSPLPATGPYMVDRYEAGHEVHLVRNTAFSEWSKDAQPAGYPEAIDWTVSSLADPSTLVESGVADVVLLDSLPAERLAQLRTREPAQLHIAPSQRTWFEMMNTHVPPFDNVLVRQAINFAADRRAIVEAWGGPLSARVTCQVIPPEYTAYEPYCPYTVAPNATGNWFGPDLAKARDLIDRAGVRGQRVTVWGYGDAGSHERVARYFTALLNDLGFKADTRLLGIGPFFDKLDTSPNEVQMAGFWAQSSSRSGMDVIVGTFTCPDFPTTFPYVGQPAGYCSQTLDEDARKARTLETTDPLASNMLLAEMDRSVVDGAPAVMAFNPTDVIFVSRRVGNYEHYSSYPVIFSQLWVH